MTLGVLIPLSYCLFHSRVLSVSSLVICSSYLCLSTSLSMSLPLIITGCISASHHHWLYLCLSSSLSMSSRVKNPRYKELEEKAATGAYGSRVTRGVDDCKPFNCRQHALLPHACAITHLLTCSCSQVCEAAAQKRAAECAEAAEGGKGKCEAPAEALSSSDKSSANEAAVRTNAHWDHYAGTTLLLIWQQTSQPLLCSLHAHCSQST